MARVGRYEIVYPDSFTVGSRYGNLTFFKSGRQNGKKQQYYLDTFRVNVPEHIGLHVHLDMEVVGIDEDGCFEVSYIENYYDDSTGIELEWENGICYMDEGHIFMISGIDDGISRLIEEAAKTHYRETKNVRLLNTKSKSANEPTTFRGFTYYPRERYWIKKYPYVDGGEMMAGMGLISEDGGIYTASIGEYDAPVVEESRTFYSLNEAIDYIEGEWKGWLAAVNHNKKKKTIKPKSVKKAKPKTKPVRKKKSKR